MNTVNALESSCTGKGTDISKVIGKIATASQSWKDGPFSYDSLTNMANSGDPEMLIDACASQGCQFAVSANGIVWVRGSNILGYIQLTANDEILKQDSRHFKRLKCDVMQSLAKKRFVSPWEK